MSFDQDKDLVGEQAGFGTSLIGILLAIFIGLVIRASISPEKIQQQVAQAFEKAPPEVSAKFEKAQLRLSDGFWPELALVVENIELKSENPCWMSPVIEINQVRLPIALRFLFQGQIRVEDIDIDSMQLNLRTDSKACKQDSDVEEKKADLSQAAGVEVLDQKSSNNKQSGTSLSENVKTKPSFWNQSQLTQAEIKSISVKDLKINYLPLVFTSTQFLNLKVLLKQNEPAWIEILGQINLASDADARDLGSLADLKLEYKSDSAPAIVGSMKGLWQEGSYGFNFSHDIGADQFDLKLNVNYLPVRQILPLLRKYKLLVADIVGKKTWISGEMKMEGKLSEFQNTPIDFTQLKLEGELGQFSIPKVRIHSLIPLKYDPVDIEIKTLKLAKFLEFLNKPHPSPVFADLGSFSGQAIFKSPEHIEMRGDYSGLEFIFSNRGSRQIQKIGLISGELKMLQGNWDIQVDRVRPLEGLFEGKLSINADRDFRDVVLKADIQELSLAPQVQVLMSGGGTLGSLNGRLKAQFSKAKLSLLEAQLKWDQLILDGIRLLRPTLKVNTMNKLYSMEVSSQELEILSGNNFARKFLDPVVSRFMDPISITSQKKNAEVSFLSHAVFGRLTTENFESLNWSQVRMSTSKGVMTSQGRWTPRGELEGKIILGNRLDSWKITGSRDKPVIERTSVK